MNTRGQGAESSLSLERLIVVGSLVVMLGLYGVFALRVRWTGTTWWERASYETGHGRNIYTQNYRIWLTGSEPEPFFGYSAGSLYVTVPLYLAAWAISGDDTPDLFVQLCLVFTAAAHVGLALVGSQVVRRQSGSEGAAAATFAALALNPILLRLGAMGDVIDLGMLWLCALYIKAVTQGQWRRAGLALSLAFIVKQFPVLLLPDFLIRALRVRRWDGAAWSLLPAAVLSLPYLVWSPGEYLFFLAGGVTALREIYGGAWWNVYAFLAGSGVPQDWLRAVSLGLLACASAAIYWATWRRRLSPIFAAALLANAFWMLYHSSYEIYIGWGSVFATIALGSAWSSRNGP